MSVNTSRSDVEDKVVISVEGRFDFSAHQEFRNAYAEQNPGSVQYVVDMAKADTMDSSALGMLLQLREHAGGSNGDVSIRNCNREIQEILRISNFNKLFQVD